MPKEIPGSVGSRQIAPEDDLAAAMFAADGNVMPGRPKKQPPHIPVGLDGSDDDLACPTKDSDEVVGD